ATSDDPHEKSPLRTCDTIGRTNRMPPVGDAVMATTEELVRAERQIRKSAEALGKALDAVETYAEPAVARSVQATKNFYDRIDTEFGLLSGSEVGRLLGSQTPTPRNRALDTRRAGRIVAIRRGNKLLYPGFQFDENGQPLAVIA